MLLKNNASTMRLEKSWYEKLKEEIQKPYITELKAFLEQEKLDGKVIYPEESLVFHAFSKTPYDQVKVVIIGQDPYHGKGQAHGLSFSVPHGIRQPPSLQNIFKELQNDLRLTPPSHGCLESWAEQGVLLLNATLTVRAGEPKSHYGKGWEEFTDAVIEHLSQRSDPFVFLLWGKSAQEKGCKLLHTHHLVLSAAHPSPYSATAFFGCKHFSKTNAFLKSVGKEPINWQIT